MNTLLFNPNSKKRQFSLIVNQSLFNSVKTKKNFLIYVKVQEHPKCGDEVVVLLENENHLVNSKSILYRSIHSCMYSYTTISQEVVMLCALSFSFS